MVKQLMRSLSSQQNLEKNSTLSTITKDIILSDRKYTGALKGGVNLSIQIFFHK